ncbi:low molecular weight phosphatase family protein [Microbacterium testaceum]|uniref:arsenate reductase/protein-tyrosine-phosphatase family protein n=1 Tax=Microbacterium testaceum TaxID=2033 RepID=UPI0012442561|nr:low molecular weight phosphatase family protein [Microbacterium testaceum]
MLKILTVCTGNICRSPLAALVLRDRLSALPVTVESAGTRARDGAPVTVETVMLAEQFGVDRGAASAHRSRRLRPEHLADADLVLAMSREHRRAVVEMDPSRVRNCFTIREFDRLAASLSDMDPLRLADAPHDIHARLEHVVSAVASQRGLLLPPADPDADDVLDPYGRSISTYARSARQLAPSLLVVERILRVVSSSV